MKQSTPYFLIFVLLFISSCGGGESYSVRNQKQKEEIQEVMVAMCLAYGFVEGTPEFNQCVIREINLFYAELDAKMENYELRRRISNLERKKSTYGRSSQDWLDRELDPFNEDRCTIFDRKLRGGC